MPHDGRSNATRKESGALIPTSSMHRDDAAVYAITQEAFQALERNRQARLRNQHRRSASPRQRSPSRHRSRSPRSYRSPSSHNSDDHHSDLPPSETQDNAETQDQHQHHELEQAFYDDPAGEYAEEFDEQLHRLEVEPMDEESAEAQFGEPYGQDLSNYSANFTIPQHDRGFQLPQVPATLAMPQRLATPIRSSAPVPSQAEMAAWIQQKETQRQAQGLPIASAPRSFALPPKPPVSCFPEPHQPRQGHRYEREGTYPQRQGPIPEAVPSRGRGRRRGRRGQQPHQAGDLFSRVSFPRR